MTDKAIDFRSDTLTLPTKEMKEAMITAMLGDDVFNEDPTITALEEHVAELAGKEKGIYCPSGTMTNLIAMMLHGEGLFSEIIVGDASHIACYEVGNAAILGSVFVRQVVTEDDGTISLDRLQKAIQVENVHNTTTRAIVLENTHNMRGGKVLPQEYVFKVREICDKHNIALHCDGARLWNAAIAQKKSMKELCAPFDTISLCLSKGLGAPVGSVLVGPADKIAKARRLRKMLGGGMRQVGVIAGAALHAVQNNFDRLAEDHENAKYLIDEVAKLGYKVIQPDSNIAIWSVGETSEERAVFLEACEKRNLLLVGMGAEANVRAIPHLGNTKEEMRKAVDIIEAVKKEVEGQQ